MNKIFAIGDIHGCYDLLELVLAKWNPEEEQLVFLGDYIDRGPDSLKVITKVMQLTHDYDAVALCGNHEQLFLGWLENPEDLSEFYFNSKVGGEATLRSFCDVPDIHLISDDFSIHEIPAKIQREQHAVIEFIKSLRRYYLWDSFLFVHAGISSTAENFRETKRDDFFWIREEFYSVPHKAKETVVFGHTPTILLNEDKSSDVWISACQKKIGIDGGGAIYEKGHLHGVVFTSGSKDIVVHSANMATGVATKHISLT